MIIYALVFSTTVAITLYVAASIFNARQRSNELNEYTRQDVFIQKMMTDSLTKVARMSMIGGYGVTDDGASNRTWYAYNSGTGYSLTTRPTGVFSGSAWYENSVLAATQLVASSVNGGNPLDTQGGSDWTSTYRWSVDDPTTRTRITTLSFTSSTPNFGWGDVFTIPGWRTFRENPNGSFVAVPAIDAAESNQDFTSLSKFPFDLTNRRDLPFGPANGNGRWLMANLEWRLQPKDNGSGLWEGLTGTTQNAVNARESQLARSLKFWTVEEPISNYQLLLLQSSNTEGWGLRQLDDSGNVTSAESQGKIIFANSASSAGTHIPKLFIYGGILANFTQADLGTGFIGVPAPAQQPIAAIVGGASYTGNYGVPLFPAAARAAGKAGNYFDWRIAPGAVAWGLGLAKDDLTVNRYSMSGVGGEPSLDYTKMRFFNIPVKDREERGNSAAKIAHMRQAEVFNAQASRMPRPVPDANLANKPEDLVQASGVNTTVEGQPFSIIATGSFDPCYINPILFIRRDSTIPAQACPVTVSWTRQKLPSGTSSMIEEMDSASYPLNQTTVAQNSIALRTNQAGIYGASISIPGVSMASRYIVKAADGSKVWHTTVTIDLRKFDLSGNTLAQSATQYPWQGPNEIHILKMGLQDAGSGYFNATSDNYSLVIIGANGSNVANGSGLIEKPLRIVTDAREVRLALDPASTPVANYRRFILLSTYSAIDTANPVRLVFEQAAGTGYTQSWYGAFLMPWGVSFDTRTGYAFTTGSYTDDTKSSSPKIFGTVLVNNVIATNARTTLTLSPDDGAGLSGGANFNSPGTVHNLFTPKYSATIPIGNPVPMVLPRMAWITQ